MSALALHNARLRFGATVINPGARELFHAGNAVPVSDRALDILLLLIEHRGTVVSKEQIMAVVWTGMIVGENTLETQISLLRRALGQDRSAIYTVSRRGYQFVAELGSDGPAASPAGPDPRFPCAPARRKGLPAVVSRLIGRDKELAELVSLIGSRRVVTLAGAGGVGKTRLAIEAARVVAPEFDDGVVFIELAATASSDYIPSTVAPAFGFPPGDGTPDLEKLIPSISHLHCLVLIDNCEHVIDGATDLVETLLQVMPHASILATSGESLRSAGEWIYRVPSLELPEHADMPEAQRYGAVQLFVERSGIATPGHDDLAFVTRICRQLDGIPLAIELAAACVQALGVRGVAERLDDRFELLRQGARNALPRQQTLRAAVDWSYALLSSRLQTVLFRLSLFAGAFTLDAAERMISSPDLPPRAVAAAVLDLVDKSLLVTLPGLPAMQYRLLDTIRAYARERLIESGSAPTGRNGTHNMC